MPGPETRTAPPPDAVQSVAQSRGDADHLPTEPPETPEAGEGLLFSIGKRVRLASRTELYERQTDDPIYRALSIFSRDPTISRLEGGIAHTRIQYERLEPGPRGSIIEVDNADADGVRWARADLDHPRILIQDGYTPSLSDPRFHQQMVYAVAMATYANFKVALGRDVAWCFDRIDPRDGKNRILLKPHGAKDTNAWYDKNKGEIVFGYFLADRPTSVAAPGRNHVFTCVSHDVIAHEMSHALLDGLRAHFLVPSHPDVVAFHEAFADLVAFFQHFTYEDVVRAAIDKTRGELERATTLVRIAQEFGQSQGHQALRTLSHLDGHGPAAARSYQEARQLNLEAHDLGGVLAQAVFEAFVTLYRRRTRRFIKLATGGSGELPPGDLAAGLQDFLVSEVRKLASQFLTVCIRAIDYCPPVDIRFGDYLRALITADRDVVPDDVWAYREAVIDAFRSRGIYGEGASSMTEDALVWNGPQIEIEPAEELGFGRMIFEGDPAKPVSVGETRRQAGALGRLVAKPEHAREFGLVSPDSPAFAAGGYELPMIESIRSARRVGPDKQVVFDIVAEVVQRRRVRLADGGSFSFYGGATVILGPRGEIRFVIRKRVDHEDRMNEQLEYIRSEAGRQLWRRNGRKLTPVADVTRRLCAVATTRRADGSQCEGKEN